MNMSGYLLNPKNNRIFKDGPNFAKMKGLVPLSVEQYNDITVNKIAPKSDEEKTDVVKKEEVKNDDTKPTVQITVAGSTLEQIEKDAKKEADQQQADSANGKFSELSRDNVTLGDVVSTQDSDLIAFGAEVLKINFLPSEEPAKMREKLIQLVAKIEKKREAKKDK